ERARTALVAQLRGVTPALSESDVTRERLALEEAVRKVEAESARQTWVEPRQEPPPPRNKVRPPDMPRWEEPLALPGQEPPPPPPAPPRRTAPPQRAEASRRPPPPPRQANGPGAGAQGSQGLGSQGLGSNGPASNGAASNGMFGGERTFDP